MKAHELLSSSLRWGKGAYVFSLATGEEIPSPTFYGRAEELMNESCFCLDGALAACYGSIHDNAAYYEARERATKAVVALTGEAFVSVITWNDHPSTRWEDVYSLLKELDL